MLNTIFSSVEITLLKRMDQKNFVSMKSKKSTQTQRKGLKKCLKSGKGLLDKIIDKLPVELHVPSYQYCGPGYYEPNSFDLYV